MDTGIPPPKKCFYFSRYAQSFSRMGYLSENVARIHGNIPNPKDEVVNDEEIIKCQTPDEFDRFISLVDETLWKALFTFLYWTGCRRGEVQALSWKDINFEKNTIRINKTLSTKIKDGGYKITNTKNRKIELLPQLKPVLLVLYKEEKKNQSLKVIEPFKKPLNKELDNLWNRRHSYIQLSTSFCKIV